MSKSKKRTREKDSEEEIRRKMLKLSKKLEKFQGKNQDKEQSESSAAGEGLSDRGRHLDENQPHNNQDNVDKSPVLAETESPPASVSLGLQPPSEVHEDAHEDIKLDSETEDLLGDDPSKNQANSVNLHQSLVARWPVWMKEGLPKESREKVVDKYPRKGNILLEAPELNEEVTHSLNEAGIKRDNLFKAEQNFAGSALSALGEAITMILNDGEEPVDRMILLERLADAGKLISHLHFQISSARKSYIAPALSKPMKDLLQKTKPGAFLYGDNLSTLIKTAKSLEKIGKEIKVSPAPAKPIVNNKPTNRVNSGRSLNWRGRYPRQGTQYQGQRNYPQKFNQAVPTSNERTQQYRSQSRTKQTPRNEKS